MLVAPLTELELHGAGSIYCRLGLGAGIWPLLCARDVLD